MATTKRARRHARETLSLSDAEEWFLLIGGESPFPSEQAEREAWMKHRDRLMALLPPDGHGYGWLLFDGGGLLPEDEGSVYKALRRIDRIDAEKGKTDGKRTAE
jgi:hypothetical protein